MNTIGRRHSEVLAICRGGNAIGGTGRRPIVLPVEARQPRRPDTLSGRARSEDQTPKDLHDTLFPGRPQASQHCLGIRRHAASDIGFGPDDPLSPRHAIGAGRGPELCRGRAWADTLAHDGTNSPDFPRSFAAARLHPMSIPMFSGKPSSGSAKPSAGRPRNGRRGARTSATKAK